MVIGTVEEERPRPGGDRSSINGSSQLRDGWDVFFLLLFIYMYFYL